MPQKISKQKVLEICKKLEEIATQENNQETQICNLTPTNDRVWIDAENLDWLSDQLKEPVAEKLRELMKYSTDFEGAYYYYDFV